MPGGGTGDRENEKYSKYADMTAEEITASLTLEQKANQMVMAACYDISPDQAWLDAGWGIVLK